MKRILAALMTFALTLGLAGGALGRTDGALVSTSVLPPDSPLFFVQHALDAWEEFLAFDPLAKARVHAKIADNRLAETATMLTAKREDIAARLSAEFAERLEKAAAALAQVKAEADRQTDTAQARARQESIDAVLARLAMNAERQHDALASVLVHVTNDTARQAIEAAMERSSHGLENAITRVGGGNAPALPDANPADPSSGTRPSTPPAPPSAPAPRRP